jgi:hypothetical protein
MQGLRQNTQQCDADKSDMIVNPKSRISGHLTGLR